MLAGWGGSSYIDDVIFRDVDDVRLDGSGDSLPRGAGWGDDTATDGDTAVTSIGRAKCDVRHRVYLPQIGRWTRRHPLGYVDGMSTYECGMSMPLGVVDPGGLCSSSTARGASAGGCAGGSQTHWIPNYPVIIPYPIVENGEQRDAACQRWAEQYCGSRAGAMVEACFNACVDAASDCCSQSLNNEVMCEVSGIAAMQDCYRNQLPEAKPRDDTVPGWGDPSNVVTRGIYRICGTNYLWDRSDGEMVCLTVASGVAGGTAAYALWYGATWTVSGCATARIGYHPMDRRPWFQEDGGNHWHGFSRGRGVWRETWRRPSIWPDHWITGPIRYPGPLLDLPDRTNCLSAAMKQLIVWC